MLGVENQVILLRMLSLIVMVSILENFISCHKRSDFFFSSIALQGDTLQTINLHQEVKLILQQLQSETRDWLTKREIESLVRSMLNPEMESLRVTLLNIANEGSSDQVEETSGSYRQDLYLKFPF